MHPSPLLPWSLARQLPIIQRAHQMSFPVCPGLTPIHPSRCRDPWGFPLHDLPSINGGCHLPHYVLCNSYIMHKGATPQLPGSLWSSHLPFHHRLLCVVEDYLLLHLLNDGQNPSHKVLTLTVHNEVLHLEVDPSQGLDDWGHPYSLELSSEPQRHCSSWGTIVV